MVVAINQPPTCIRNSHQEMAIKSGPRFYANVSVYQLFTLTPSTTYPAWSRASRFAYRLSPIFIRICSSLPRQSNSAGKPPASWAWKASFNLAADGLVDIIMIPYSPVIMTLPCREVIGSATGHPASWSTSKIMNANLSQSLAIVLHFIKTFGLGKIGLTRDCNNSAWATVISQPLGPRLTCGRTSAMGGGDAGAWEAIAVGKNISTSRMKTSRLQSLPLFITPARSFCKTPIFSSCAYFPVPETPKSANFFIRPPS